MGPKKCLQDLNLGGGNKSHNCLTIFQRQTNLSPDVNIVAYLAAWILPRLVSLESGKCALSTQNKKAMKFLDLLLPFDFALLQPFKICSY